MAFLLNSQEHSVFGEIEQSIQTPWRGDPRGAGPNAAASA